MPALTDLSEVRRRLEIDRVWAAFSLADLDEPWARHAHWHGLAGSDALVLVYDAFDPPIVYIQGEDSEVERVLSAGDVRAATARAWLNVQPGHAALVARQFATFDARVMVRMWLDLERYRPVSGTGVVRLGPEDLDALTALYGEDRPDFFVPSQVSDGVYFGVQEAGRLVSVAGTHVLSRSGSVAALGNVYTAPAARGRRLAAAATSAVVQALLAQGISTIVLNIIATNHAARRVYERLGFVDYCVYHEGAARR